MKAADLVSIGRSGRMVPEHQILSALLSAACMSACTAPPEFSVSLGSPGEDFDSRLTGRWQLIADVDDPVVFAHIWPDESGSVLNINYVGEHWNGLNDVGIREWSFFAWSLEAHPTKIAGEVFYNVRRRGAYAQWNYTPNRKPGYMILRPVWLDDDTLVVCGLLWNRNNLSNPPFTKFGFEPQTTKTGFPDRTGQIRKEEGETIAAPFIKTDRERLRSMLLRADAEEAFFPALAFRRMGTGLLSMETSGVAAKNQFRALAKRHGQGTGNVNRL